MKSRNLQISSDLCLVRTLLNPGVIRNLHFKCYMIFDGDISMNKPETKYISLSITGYQDITVIKMRTDYFLNFDIPLHTCFVS